MCSTVRIGSETHVFRSVMVGSAYLFPPCDFRLFTVCCLSRFDASFPRFRAATTSELMPIHANSRLLRNYTITYPRIVQNPHVILASALCGSRLGGDAAPESRSTLRRCRTLGSFSIRRRSRIHNLLISRATSKATSRATGRTTSRPTGRVTSYVARSGEVFYSIYSLNKFFA